jgi:glycosyltransferase involved in cell wall biosynthesis
MEIDNLPSISVVIPTFNSENTLGMCLESIVSQDYPKDKIKIIIADGGSVDKTLEIAKRYTDKIFNNQLKTGEAGRIYAYV